jgi:hypothetical protein
MGALLRVSSPVTASTGENMDVWIVEAGADYEGAYLTAVCSTEKKAEGLRDKWERESSHDWVSANKYTVDAHEPDFSHFT